MLISHTFKPKTSTYNKKATIDFTFIYPLYKRKVNIIYGVFYIATFYTFIAFS